MTDAAKLYAGKQAEYFTGARHDMLAALGPSDRASILEVGCGDGATGLAALASGATTRYVGIELMPAVAEQARANLTDVIVGNVEQMDLQSLHGQFDALILSEVLEHLVDPWTTLSRLAACLKPGGQVIASSPNIAQWNIIAQLIRGRFEYQDAGAMDRTHLRWFTPGGYAALIKHAGFDDIRFVPLRRSRLLVRALHTVTLNRFSHLSMTQVMVQGRYLTTS
jgi:2-polyprenyl-3-methyl-5-hydroxy-6-metoxy-1,4-benzoquinol methylase